MASEGTRSRRRRTEYTKDGPRREVRQKVVRRSYTHRDSSRSFLFFLFPFFPSCSFFLFYRRSAVASFDVPPPGRNVPYSSRDLRTELYNARLAYRIAISCDPDRFRLFLRPRANFERAKLLLRSHKRAWPRIEWLVMGVNYVQLYCVCVRGIY